MGNWVVSIALFGWIPAVLALFMAFPPRRAVIGAFLLAWLFLPMAGFKLAEGVPVYDKMSATCVGVLLGMVAFDLRRLQTFRPGWIDLPMLVWCLCPIASSLSNDLGVYDGTSAVFGQMVSWGLPYFIGRVYFSDLASLKELAVGLFIGGLIYVPLCLLEIRMSPQLHTWVYGYHQHTFAQTIRMGGWRPTVFMGHGLMVGMWMCMTALIGVWLWYARALPRSICRIPTAWALVALVVTAVLCKSTGAILLLGLGLAGLFAVPVLRTKWVIWALVISGPLYMAVRAGGVWDGMSLVDWTRSLSDEERAGSLLTRVTNENSLSSRALERPWFGWGGWARNFVPNEQGGSDTIPDGMWVITLGVTGGVGLGALVLVLLLPPSLLLARIRVADWSKPVHAPAVVLAVVLVLYQVDCIPNAMGNPVFMVICGGLATTGMSLQRAGMRVVPRLSGKGGLNVAKADRQGRDAAGLEIGVSQIRQPLA